MKARHAAHRNILPLPELSEWTIFIKFVIYGNFLEQFYYFVLSDFTLESLQVSYNFFVILSSEVLEQTLINLMAIEVAPPP